MLCFAPAKSLRPPQVSWWDCLLLPKWTGIRFVEKGGSSGWWWRCVNGHTDQVQQKALLINTSHGRKTNLHLFRRTNLLYGTINAVLAIAFPLKSQFPLTGSLSSSRQPVVFYLERLKWWLSCPRCRIGVKSSELFYLFIYILKKIIF